MKNTEKTKEELISELETLKKEIAKTKKIENQIIESEEKYRTLSENSHDMIQSVNNEGNFIFVNSAWKNKLGYSEEESKKMNFSQIVHPEHIKQCNAEFNKILTGKESRDIRTVFLTKSGNQIIVEGNNSPLIKDNQVIATHGIFRDITQKKQVEEEMQHINEINNEINSGTSLNDILQKTVQRIAKTYKYHTCDIYTYEKENDYLKIAAISFSPGLIKKIEKLSGLNLKNLKIPLNEGSGFTEIIQKKQTILIDDPVKALKDFSDKKSIQAFAGPIAQIMKFKFGVRVPLIVSDKVIGILGVSSDKKYTSESVLSLERFAEQLALIINKAKNDAALSESQEQFKSIVEFTPTPILLTSLSDGKILFGNEALSRLVNISFDKLIGLESPDFYADPSQRAEIINTLKKKGDILNKELKIKKADGTPIWVIASMKVMVINNESIIFCGLTDITEHKKAEIELHKKHELNDKIQNTIVRFANEEINNEYKLQYFIEKILKTSFDIFNHDRLSVWLPNEKGFYLAAYEGNAENPEGLDFLSGIEFSKYIKFMKNNRLLISNDVNKDNRLNELKDYFTVTNSRSMLDASAVINDEIIAIICYEKISLHNWSTEEISFMRSISEQFVSVYLRIEEQNSQIKLKDSELKLNSFFNFAPIGIAINHLDGTFTKVNVEFTRITGYTAEELNNLSYWDLTPKEYAAQEEIQLKSIAENKAYGPYEKEYTRKDGKRIPVLLKGIIIQSGGEDFIWSVVEDITISKQKETEVINIAKELRQFIETANAPIFGIDKNGNVNEWNETAEKITKFSKEDVMGKDLVEEFISEDYKISVKNVLDEALGGKETSNYEFPLYTKDKRRVIIMLNFSTRRDTLGNIVGVLGIGQDITEMAMLRSELGKERENLVKKVEERTAELSFSNAELAKSARMKDEFLASMSHELRTPLNTILGLSESLQEKVFGELNDDQIDSLKNIEESGHHLLELINEILDLAKIEAGKVVLEYNEISIESICQTSLRFIRQLASTKQIKVVSSITSTVETFQADEKRLRQILINLLNNAVKFTKEGGQIGLDVLTDVKNQVINFKVWDTGIGIAEDNLDDLFKPFIQIDSSLSREFEGSGLGLALVKNLTELHGGSISVESEPGKGSSFTVSLPLVENSSMIETDTPDTEKESHKPANIEQSKQSIILLAEDNLQNINTFTKYLNAKGFSVIIALNGIEAIKKLEEITPDVILMDIQMPVMDGMEATKQIRANNDPRISNIPIIALTALAMPGDREKCLNAGANEYMKKPVGLKDLVKTINALVGKKE